MLSQYLKKVNNWLGRNQKECILALIVLLVGTGSFELGRLSLVEPEHTSTLQIYNHNPPTHSLLTSAYVASKSGTLYYTPRCSGVNRIKEENKVWFQTKEEAETKGYKAASCK